MKQVRDVIVIGGSAGALEPLCCLLEALPQPLPASIFVVIHIPEKNSSLDQVLDRCGVTRVAMAENGQRVERGQVYLAPGGSHLLVNDGQIELSKGPRENRHRPSIDALFRSAARAHRDRVIAVVLSGGLDDGSAGAFAVKARGGLVVVQDPAEAAVRDMPANVLRHVKADFCLPVSKIGPKLVQLIQKNEKSKKPAQPVKGRNGSAGGEKAAPFVCPDCGGPVTQYCDGTVLRFRCQVGHAFSPDALTQGHADALERALWVALRHLSERRAIQQTLAGQYEHDPEVRKRFEENAQAATQDIALLREIVERL